MLQNIYVEALQYPTNHSLLRPWSSLLKASEAWRCPGWFEVDITRELDTKFLSLASDSMHEAGESLEQTRLSRERDYKYCLKVWQPQGQFDAFVEGQQALSVTVPSFMYTYYY